MKFKLREWLRPRPNAFWGWALSMACITLLIAAFAGVLAGSFIAWEPIKIDWMVIIRFVTILLIWPITYYIYWRLWGDGK